MDDFPLIDIDSLEDENEESWLVSASTSDNYIPSCSESPPLPPTHTLRKKTLVQKLEELSRGSYYNNGYSRGGYHRASPPSSALLSSTPLRNAYLSSPDPVLFKCSEIENGGNRTFDSRTFTRRAGARVEKKLLSLSNHGDNRMNLTFEKLDLNSTFDKEPLLPSSKDGTFIKVEEDGDANRTYCTNEAGTLNLTYDAVPAVEEDDENPPPPSALNENLNSTFQLKGDSSSRKMSEDRLSSASSPTPANGNLCLSREESSSHGDLDDALSTTSDSSASHRLNDVGDVQHIAKLQEESLKQSASIGQQQPYARSATISPSSEHSPLTEDGNPAYYPSEDGSVASDNNGICSNNGVRYQQYSSQDSLPDSPYSSQSLDSQPATGQDRIGRSMPNLNKIRQNRGRGGTSGLPPPSSMGGRPSYYGPDSGHLSQRRSVATMYQHPSHQPQRGGGLAHQSASDSNLRNPSVSTSAVPRPSVAPLSAGLRTTGIPRRGSRIPAPSGIPRSSGIPKPSGSRLPTTVRKTSYSSRPGSGYHYS